MKAIFLCENEANVRRVYAPVTVTALAEIAGLDTAVYTAADLRKNPRQFADVELIFSTWGMSELTADEIRAFLPRLSCVFYAAGTVQYFARPFLECGVRVFSAWAANAVPVAEYAVSQILLANKGFFSASRVMKTGDNAAAHAVAAHFPGNYGAKVGIIGAGMIGKLIIRMLAAYRLEVLTFDPFLPEETAKALGVTKCDLLTLFSECQVVSNHLANNAQTQGMLHYALFERMCPYATFINTGRGAQVVEADLGRILQERPDLTAVLDVTYPEPPAAGHAFYALDNCVLTPHIAGSSGDEVHRMAEYMQEEYACVAAGKPCQYEVTAQMLKTMA